MLLSEGPLECYLPSLQGSRKGWLDRPGEWTGATVNTRLATDCELHGPSPSPLLLLTPTPDLGAQTSNLLRTVPVYACWPGATTYFYPLAFKPVRAEHSILTRMDQVEALKRNSNSNLHRVVFEKDNL